MVLFIKSSSQETSDRGKACEQPSTIQNPDRSYKVRSTKTKVEIKRVRPRIAEPPLHTHTLSLSLSLSREYVCWRLVQVSNDYQKKSCIFTLAQGN